jgi:hypothetical protein
MMKGDISSSMLEDNPQATDVKEWGAGIVQALYRALKVVQMHSMDHPSVERQLKASAESIRLFHLRTNHFVQILFARGVVFFGIKPLQAHRAVYESALALGEMIDACGGNELIISNSMTLSEFREFVVGVVSTLREPSQHMLKDAQLPSIRLRHVQEEALTRGIFSEQLSFEQRLVRVYASAIVVVRQFYLQLRQSPNPSSTKMKRISQSLVELFLKQPSYVHNITQVRKVHRDLAGKAVNSAIIAIAIANQLSQERTTLAQLALATLLFRVGYIRSPYFSQILANKAVELNPDQQRSLPAATAVAMAAIDQGASTTIRRQVMVYESVFLSKRELASLYLGEHKPTLFSRIISIAWAFNERLTPEEGTPPRSTAEAIIDLENDSQRRVHAGDPINRLLVRLLLASLPKLPAGLLIQLSSGEVAVVIDTPHEPDSPFTQLRLILDSQGARPSDQHPNVFVLGSDQRTVAKIVGIDPDFSVSVPPPVAPTTSVHPNSSESRSTTSQRPHFRSPQPPSVSSRPFRPSSPTLAYPSPDPNLYERGNPTTGHPPDAQPQTPPPASARVHSSPPPVPRTTTVQLASTTYRQTTGRSSPIPRSRTKSVMDPSPIPPHLDLDPVFDAELIVEQSKALKSEEKSLRQLLGSMENSLTPATPPSSTTERQSSSRPFSLHPWLEKPTGNREHILSKLRSSSTPIPQPSAEAQSKEPRGKIEMDFEFEDEDSLAVTQANAIGDPVVVEPPVDAQRAPDLSGDLNQTPLPHLLVYCREHLLTGIITLYPNDRPEHYIVLKNGLVQILRTSLEISPLGMTLVRLGLVDVEQIEPVVERARHQGELLGKQMIHEGLADRRSVELAIREQTALRFRELLKLPTHTRFEYYAEEQEIMTLSSEFVPTEPLALVLVLVREWQEVERIVQVLRPWEDRHLRFHPVAEPSRFKLNDFEQEVVDIIQEKTLTLNELRQLFSNRNRELERLIYTLLIAKHLGEETPSIWPVGIPKSRSSSIVPASIILDLPRFSCAANAENNKAGCTTDNQKT